MIILARRKTILDDFFSSLNCRKFCREYIVNFRQTDISEGNCKIREILIRVISGVGSYILIWLHSCVILESLINKVELEDAVAQSLN